MTARDKCIPEGGMMSTIRKIGILTGGGDCPGLNPVIRAITKTAILEDKWEVVGIKDGYQGLVEAWFEPLTYEKASSILNRGGTILGTSNTANPLNYCRIHDGVSIYTDETETVLTNVANMGLDALVCVGGDGTMAITAELCNRGLQAVGVPKTIDNDLAGTDLTFGFQSAVDIVTLALDNLHSTAESHHRVLIVEVMGRYAGWIALHGGVAGGGDIILIPEIPFEIEKVCAKIRQRMNLGKRFSIVVVAEGAVLKGGSLVVDTTIETSPDPIRLGGIGRYLKDLIDPHTGADTRVVVLGHLQRGGSPCPFDRVLATRMGYHAIELIRARRFGRMVCLRGWDMDSIPMAEVANLLRKVPVEHHLIKAARAVGTIFGD